MSPPTSAPWTRRKGRTPWSGAMPSTRARNATSYRISEAAMKIRQNLYIDRELSDALEALAAGPRGNKSHLVNDALKDWLARGGTKEIDDLLTFRLDRRTRELAGARRDIDDTLEKIGRAHD